jgi:glycerol uptake facilitator-like aquaporin
MTSAFHPLRRTLPLTYITQQFLTAHLMFTILMLAAEKSKDTFIAPIGIGLALFVVEIAGINYSGGSINPARSFGPCVAGTHFTGYHWIYWLGPVMGSCLAAGFYHFIKVRILEGPVESGHVCGIWLTCFLLSSSTTSTRTLAKTARRHETNKVSR